MKLFGNTSRKGKNKGKARSSRPAMRKHTPQPENAADFFPDGPDDGQRLADAESVIDGVLAESTGSPDLSDMPDESAYSGEAGEDDGETGLSEVKKHKLSGLQRGLIILGGALAMLVVLVMVIWNAFATPPEIAMPTPHMAASAEPKASGGISHVTVTTAPTAKPSTDPETGDEQEENLAEVLNVSGDRKEGWYTVLLVGTDFSEYLTDTIIACSFDTVNHKLNLVSIPRDTFVDMKKAVYKINSAFSVGVNSGRTVQSGMDSLLSEVSKILGFQVDAYCMINLEAFVDIVDIIGGVDFNVPCNMKYDDPYQNLHINLAAGQQLLDGQKCMQLVRFRGYPAADLQRVKVQQDFMKALAKKLLSIGTARKVTDLAKVVSDNLFTNLSFGNIVWFGQELLKVDMDDITTQTLTGEGGGWKNVSYYFLYGYDTVDTVNEFLNPFEQDFTIDDLFVYTLENGVVSRSLRSTTYNQHAYSNYGYTASTGSSSSAAPSTPSGSGQAASQTPVKTDSQPDEPEDDAETEKDTESGQGEGGDSGGTADAPTAGDSADQPDDAATQLFG